MYLPRLGDPVCAEACEASARAIAPAPAISHARVALFFLKAEFAAALVGAAMAAGARFGHRLPLRLDLLHIAALGGVAQRGGSVNQGLEGRLELGALRPDLRLCPRRRHHVAAG